MSTETTTTMTSAETTEQNAEIVRLITESGMNQGHTDLDHLFASDYQVHGAGLRLPPGPSGYYRAVGLWRTAFPDWHIDLEQLVAEGDFVADRFHTTGTHQGPLFGVAATGRRVEVHGTDMHRVVDGQVQESWISDDVPRIIDQLGIGRLLAERGAA